MNNKARFVFLVIIGLILCALVSREGKVMVVVMPFLSYLVVALMYLPSKVALQARRSITSRKMALGKTWQVLVMVENTGDTCTNLLLDDPLPGKLQVVSGTTQAKAALHSDGKLELSYTFQAQRGLYAWNAIHAVVSDPFELFEIVRDLPAPGNVYVPPGRVSLRNIPLKPSFTRHSAGLIPARLAGPGLNFWGIREYLPGDSLRSLNWRMTARHPGKFFTKEFEREEIAEIGLILDARLHADCQVNGESLFEYSVRAAMSLSELFLKDGNRVGLLIFGKRISTVFPAYGKWQLHRITCKLSGASADSELPISYLRSISTLLFPSRSLLILISPLRSQDLQDIQRLLASGYQVLLISPDPIEFSLRRLPADQVTALAGKAAKVERFLLLKQLMRYGVRVVNWPVDEPIGHTLDQYLHPVGFEARRRR